MNMKSVAVLLTVHNRREKTLKCLELLFENNVPDGYSIEAFLTDDGCTDGTAEAVENMFPQVHIIKGDGNLYWNRGMWTAWDAASKTKNYDFYLWLNDDTYVFDDMLASLLSVSEEKCNQSIIVGATVDSQTRSVVTYGGRYHNREIPSLDGENHEVPLFNGNIVLIPSRVFKIVGNLDKYYTHGKGDYDYGLRAGKHGVRMFQVGHALGVCDRHEQKEKWSDPAVPLSQRWKALHKPNGQPPREMFYFERKHYGFMIALFHYCTIYFRCVFPSFYDKLKKR